MVLCYHYLWHAIAFNCSGYQLISSVVQYAVVLIWNMVYHDHGILIVVYNGVPSDEVSTSFDIKAWVNRGKSFLVGSSEEPDHS